MKYCDLQRWRRAEALLHMWSERLSIHVLRVTFPAHVNILAIVAIRTVLRWARRRGREQTSRALVFLAGNRGAKLLVCGCWPAVCWLDSGCTGHLRRWEAGLILLLWCWELPHVWRCWSHVSESGRWSWSLLLWPDATVIAESGTKLLRLKYTILITTRNSLKKYSGVHFCF